MSFHEFPSVPTGSFMRLSFVTGIATLTAVLILAWGFSVPYQQAFDDAYITYRYADNLRQGAGLVYNPGEWVLGTTTPFFAILLGVLGVIVSDLEWLGFWVGVICWIGAAWAGLGLFWQAERPFAAILAALFIALQPTVLRSLGMETPLVVVLMLASAWAWLGRRKKLAVVFLALLIVTRPDGVLWALLLGLSIWYKEKQLPWREALGTVLLLLPWLVFAQWRYGSILPNSASAKIGQTGRMYLESQSGFLPGFWQMMTASLLPFILVILCMVLLMGIWVVVKAERPFAWLFVWPVVYLAVYTALGVANFPWYYPPPITILMLLVALGLGYWLGDGRSQPIPAPLPSAPSIVKWTGFICAGLLLMNQWQQLRETQIGYTFGYRPEYREVGNWLATHTPTGSTVAAIEIGMIGYLSQRPIIDTMGLITPQMTNHQLGWRETLVYATHTFWPDYAVTLQGTAWEGVVTQWWFYERYRPVAQFDSATIYERIERPSLPHQLPTQTIYQGGLILTGLGLGQQTLEPGTALDTEWHFQVMQPQTTDYVLTVYLIDAQTDERTAVTKGFPFDGGYVTSLWQPGDDLAVPVRLLVPTDLTPGAYRLGLLVYDPEREEGLLFDTLPEGAYPELQLGWLRLGDPVAATETAEPQTYPLQTGWQDGITLLNLSAAVQPDNDYLPIELTWQANSVPQGDWKVFVHLVDENGNLVAQLDERPLDGRFPTPVWQPGEILTDLHQLPLPANLPGGVYNLRIGLYDENGRLPLIKNNEDFLLLPHTIQITDH